MQTGSQNYILSRVSNLTFISGAGSPLLNFEYITASGVPFFYYNDNVPGAGQSDSPGTALLLVRSLQRPGRIRDPEPATGRPDHARTLGPARVLRPDLVLPHRRAEYRRRDWRLSHHHPQQRPFNPSNSEYGPGAWELAAQYTGLNVGTGDIQRGFADPRWATRLEEVQLGVNWWPNKYVRVSFDWVHDQLNKSIPWPVNNNSTSMPATQVKSNPVDQFNIFWGRVAFFF